ncbi:hypothetical protein MXB_4320 [Myxobolus squamalis]|nr:hypothetical protein MXB_4320 [Myxobolus squamalis]
MSQLERSNLTKFIDSSDKSSFDENSCSNKNENKQPGLCLEECKGTRLNSTRPATTISCRSQGARISKIPWLEAENKESLKQFDEVEDILNSFYNSNFSENKIPTQQKPPLPNLLETLAVTDTEKDKTVSICQPNEALATSEGDTSRTSVYSDSEKVIINLLVCSDKMMQELDKMIDENSIYSTEKSLDLLGPSLKGETVEKKINFNPLDGPPFRCVSCSQIIDDELCRTENSVWHPYHFNCAVCNKSLIDEDFFEIDYELYCHIDYELKFLQKCAVCNEYIYNVLAFFLQF